MSQLARNKLREDNYLGKFCDSYLVHLLKCDIDRSLPIPNMPTLPLLPQRSFARSNVPLQRIPWGRRDFMLKQVGRHSGGVKALGMSVVVFDVAVDDG